MKKIFALCLLLSSPLCAMHRNKTDDDRAFIKEINKDSSPCKIRKAIYVDADIYSEENINEYIEMFASAAANNQQRRLRALAQSGFDSYLTHPNAVGATPLYWACQNGHTEIVKYLLSIKRDGAYKTLMLNGKVPSTALHIAAIKGHVEIVELLINGTPADRNSQHAPKKQTPLHYALANGRTKVAALLLNKNASYNLEDEDGNTPLSLAAKCEYDPALSEAFGKENVLIAAKHGWATEIAALIALKVNLEETDPAFKATPLMWAANAGYANSVKLLLDAGANIKAKNKDGLTALDCAKKRNMLDAVAVLEEALKKAQARDDKGKDEATN